MDQALEVVSGRLALERTQQNGVRGFAAQTVKDASEMLSEFLASIFRGYGANGESDTLRVYAAKSATDYDEQLQKARTVAGSLQ